ncbi:MAG: hypothetical protein QOF21_1061 [Actinomycetota bacterium]|jgi:hypothetical protein
MKRILRDNGLSIVLMLMFVLMLVVGQSWSGMRTYNADQVQHGESPVSYPTYLTTSHFGEATFENWESEFLQMGAFVVLTIWLRQRGSSESKPVEGDSDVDEDPTKHQKDADAPWPVRRGGFALSVYRHSLSIAFFGLFLSSFLLHALTGAHAFNAEQAAHGAPAVTTWQFMERAQFWFESFQNWQSEFLAVAAIVILTIFLRQQGSPESKPVHASYAETPS